MSEKPTKVAIVGGGCAGIAAAFELSRPEHGGRYEVTVYQQGWRLGGKGASGRGINGRIEEHGLHLWMGYYDNAFRLLRECYDELRRVRRPGYWTWRDAFHPVTAVGVHERNGDERSDWLAYFPLNEMTPGDPHEQGQRFSMLDYLTRGLELAVTLLRSSSNHRPRASSAFDALFAEAGALADPLRLAASLLSEGLPYAEAALLVAAREALSMWQQVAAGAGTFADLSGAAETLGRLQRALEERLDGLARTDTRRRRTLEVVEVVLANLRGTVRFGLMNDPRGFDAVDDYEYRDWLKLSGASDRALNSPLVRGLYNLAFAYEDGDVSKPRLSAALALRAANRAFFTYKGAIFWKMNAGMGDVVFAPFYEVLSARGVRFEFFHRLERVQMAGLDARDGETPHVAALHFDVQAHVRDDRPYEPLIDVKGLSCWPSTPDYAQLVDGDALRDDGVDFESHWDTRSVGSKTLEVSRDFDFAVLAVGLGAIPYVCQELVQHDRRWQEMVEHVKTIPTRAMQLWLKPDLEALGWRAGSFDLSGLSEPFDTWADMTHLGEAEAHDQAPGTIAYYCSVLPDERPEPPRSDRGYPGRVLEEVEQAAERFLDQEVRHIWPDAVDSDGGFSWELLATTEDEERLTGPQRLRTQYYRANVNPSDRYTLSLPGSARYRISPLDETYDNLTIAGDWTDGYNIGCVESAFLSGRLAAHALSASPPLEQIVGFDQP